MYRGNVRRIDKSLQQATTETRLALFVRFTCLPMITLVPADFFVWSPQSGQKICVFVCSEYLLFSLMGDLVIKVLQKGDLHGFGPIN